MIMAFDARFLLHGFVHPHSRLVDVFLRQNRNAPVSARLVLYTDREPDRVAFDACYAAPNVEVRVIGKSRGRWGRLFWLWRTLPRALGRDRVTAFYSSFYFLPPRVAGVRLVNSIHDCCVFYIDPNLNRGLLSSPTYLWILKRMMRWTNRRADATVTVSHFSRQMLHRYLGLPLNAVEVCYHGIEQEEVVAREACAASADLPYFLFVGSNLPKKNIRQCIAGFARLPLAIRSKYRLVLKTDCYPENRVQIAELAVSDQVEFVMGRLDEPAMTALFRNASLVLLLSYDEGFGLPIIEAFAADVPVLVSNRAACDEIVTFPESKANPDDTDEIARKWLSLVNDQAVRERCLAEQRRLLPKYSFEAAAGAFYRAVAAGEPTPAEASHFCEVR